MEQGRNTDDAHEASGTKPRWVTSVDASRLLRQRSAPIRDAACDASGADQVHTAWDARSVSQQFSESCVASDDEAPIGLGRASQSVTHQA